jgi:hypothetical protein
MRKLASSAAIVVWALMWPLPTSAQVRLSIDEGRVTLNATNATMGQILAEWARVGQTTIVNGDRVPGNVVALELSDISENDALEIILRSVSGYVLAPRPELVRNASRYDRILILPTSSPVRTQGPVTGVAGAPTTPSPRPQFSPPPTREEDPSQAGPADATPSQPAARAPGFNVFPQPQQPATPPPSAPTNSPTVPPGVSMPGMVPAPPAQPSQPAGSSTAPRR